MNTDLTLIKATDSSKHRQGKTSRQGLLFLLALGALAASGIQAAATPSAPETARRALLAQSFGQRPLSFEANLGQTDPTVRFLSRGQGYSLFLTPTEAVLSLRKAASQSKPQSNSPLPGKIKPVTADVLRMQLQGANPAATVEGLNQLPGKTHYLRGKDPKAWRTGIPSYAKVKYSAVYPGIDLVYYGKQRQLEYDFIVAPGADPKTIRLQFSGAEQLALDDKGRLVVTTPGGGVIQHKPVIYQEIDGVRKEVAGSYALHPDKQGKTADVGFQVARYDTSRPLVIDPVLAYSTYLGGADYDIADDIAVDGSGNAYIIGETNSPDFPIVNAEPLGNTGGIDAFVTKFNAQGTAIIYSTYLGGEDSESGTGIAVDNKGNALITGYTDSTDFPTRQPLQANCLANATSADVFVAKLNASGTALIYATCLGGSSSDFGQEIAVDRFGNAYITGLTFSSDFPTANPLQTSHLGQADAFVAKINPTGSALIYSTYLGGNEHFGESGNGIAVDRFGNAYIVGYTTASDFPALHPIQTCARGFSDTFVTKLNAKGTALVYSTCLGGNDDTGFGLEAGYGIAVDRFGNAYVTGHVSSTGLPTVHPVQASCSFDAFISKLNTAGTQLIYSTCFSGSGGYSYGAGIAVDRLGNAYVTGYTESSNFPKVRPIQPTCIGTDGTGDAFVTKFNAAGTALVYSTCMGSSSDAYLSDAGSAIAVDRFGNAYVTGITRSPDFPTKNAFQPTFAGGLWDAFVLKVVGN
jgi:hypothetical protein